MKAIDPEGFEEKFKRDIDPWAYRTSSFEAFKRKVLLQACGARHYGRGLELGCAIGETSRVLAKRCLRLTAIDSSPTALAEARRSIPLSNIDFRVLTLPSIPPGCFDLIVMSEIAYYLRRNDLRILIARLRGALSAGGRLVALHHVRSFGDAAQPPALVQADLVRTFGRTMRMVVDHKFGRFQVVAFVKPYRQAERQTSPRTRRQVALAAAT